MLKIAKVNICLSRILLKAGRWDSSWKGHEGYHSLEGDNLSNFEIEGEMKF